MIGGTIQAQNNAQPLTPSFLSRGIPSQPRPLNHHIPRNVNHHTRKDNLRKPLPLSIQVQTPQSASAKTLCHDEIDGMNSGDLVSLDDAVFLNDVG